MLCLEGAPTLIIAIDPGRSKCGLACLRADGTVAGTAIIPPDGVVAWVRRMAGAHRVSVVMGDGTGHRAIGDLLSKAGIEWQAVDEKDTSRAARARYLADHPAQGLRRLIPRGLLTPGEPYDDYVALILAERSLAAHLEPPKSRT